MYAQIVINEPVDAAFDYHIPDELDGQIAPGHLVLVEFRTATQPGIVIGVRETAEVARTKPILERLDPQPVVTPEQISLAYWLHDVYLAPIGMCVWSWLPPGMTAHRDILVDLIEDYPGEQVIEAIEGEIVALLEKRGALRGNQLDHALSGKNWRAAVDVLVKAEVLTKTPILVPPRTRPRVIATAALNIPADEITERIHDLERPSRAADLLEVVAAIPGIARTDALKAARASESHIHKLMDHGLIRDDGDSTLYLAVAAGEVPMHLDDYRRITKPRRVLNILARHDHPVEVSWLYAQADCTLNDLRRLEDAGLITLGEEEQQRDSLANKTFIPAVPPALTPEQDGVWRTVQAAVVMSNNTPPLTPPRIRGGELSSAEWSENNRAWQVPKELYEKLKPLAREHRKEPTKAEALLWESLRDKQLNGIKFRRQHPIERFIVDFYCPEARLIIEVDGEIHQYTQEEDAIRQEILESLGHQVIRFTNDEVLNALPDVLASITEAVRSRGAKSPLPEFGEGTGVGSSLKPFLLHGVTGSGKTEIYLRAIELTLALGRSAIFLVPEIALTPQTVARVAARFPNRVAVIHSALSDGERYDTWRRARDGQIRVVVGARSALFTPLRDIGLIILDEEHETSYKHTPPLLPPYYHARDLAEAMMHQHNAVLILGSATPDMESMYRAERGEIELLRLPQRIMGHREHIRALAGAAGVTPRYSGSAGEALTIDLPPVEIVDMREELKVGNTSIYSRALQDAIRDTLERKEQAILFLNRRGQATYVFCRDCGYVAKCPRCDAPLTHHRVGEMLRCHRCGYLEPEPEICPNCKSRRIKYFGAGTQQVEQSLVKLFPRARVVRWDGDTAASQEAHEAILGRFIERKADIMVGTQMVAKGHDLPLVTLVGVVSADTGLALPDFRAEERTFQLLTQVAGRAGRGILGGRVIVQTYQPRADAITTAAQHDYGAFYAREIEKRRDLGYPPFRRMVRVLFRFPNEQRARREAERTADRLRARLKELNMTGTAMIGPAPCFFTRENKLYRWQLVLYGPDPRLAFQGLDFPRGVYVDVDPVDVL